MSRRPAERGTETATSDYGRKSDSGRGSLDIPRFSAEIRARTETRIQKHKRGKVHRAKAEDLKKELTIDDHRLDISELAARYVTDLNATDPRLSRGLTMAEAERRLTATGPNVLTPPPVTPAWLRFLKQFTGFFTLLLEIAGVLAFVAYAIDPASTDFLWLGLVLWTVVILNGIFSFSQEQKSQNVMAGFRNMVPQQSRVIRDGDTREVPASTLVIGDVVSVKGGDKVPADLRLILVQNLKVDNSSLTGESEPQGRAAEMSHENPMETKNLAFFGTLAVEGQALGVVVKTGDETLIGRIAGLASTAGTEETPLRHEIEAFIKLASAIAISFGIAFFIIGLAIGASFFQAIVYGIGFLTALVPEGLLPALTVALTLTASKMAQRRVLVKNLEAVETLGSTSTICSDKTGTLTQNRMTVSHVWYSNHILTSDTAVTEGTFDPDDVVFQRMQRVSILCNRADFEPLPPDAPIVTDVNKRKTIGDASESALIRFTEPMHRISRVRQDYPKLAEIPFNSTNKYQISIHRQPAYAKETMFPPRGIGMKKTVHIAENPESTHAEAPPLVAELPRLVVMKGAPERVFFRCSHILTPNGPVPIDAAWRTRFEETCKTLMALGERVLGFAEKELDLQQWPADFDAKYQPENEQAFPKMEGLLFCGLMSLIDPARPSVPDAVALCRQAGVRVIMVTGDHPLTAKAIAQNVGIITYPTEDDVAGELGLTVAQFRSKYPDIHDRVKAVVVHGEQIPELTEADWDFILSRPEVVFARTSPAQKLQIVEHAQRRGEVVAVTGDGVNDSPALKKANIGVAMGIAGSDVAKEAADLILMDDNFSSIVAGVEEGRLVYDNIKKVIAYMLPSNIAETTPFIAFTLIGLPLPLSAILVLVISAGTDIFPAISLAYETAESDIMMRKPRNVAVERMVTTRLISFSYLQIGIILSFAGFFAYFVAMGDLGFSPGSLVGAARDHFGGSSGADEMEVNGRYFSNPEQMEALRRGQSAYFIAVVLCQVANLLVCRTRISSLFHHGLQNTFLNVAIAFELLLAVIIVYVPLFNTVFQTRPVHIRWWLAVLPWFFILLFYEELRKFIVRHDYWTGRKGKIARWIARKTNW